MVVNEKEYKSSYLEKRNVVVEYINNNLGNKISISELAEISNLSKFHFHRVIKGLLGEAIGSYITRTKVEKASILIRYTDLEINEIAYKVGYNNASSLNRVFKQYYNLTPLEYRNNKEIKLSGEVKDVKSILLAPPELKTIPSKMVVYIRNVGAYEKDSITGLWNNLSSYIERKKLFYNGIENFGISYDDPSVTPPNKCRYDACFTLSEIISPTGNIGVKELEGGKFAVFSYQGSYDNWPFVYDYIFDEWLLKSKYNLRNSPIMEQFINRIPHGVDSELEVKIYLPIEKL